MKKRAYKLQTLFFAAFLLIALLYSVVLLVFFLNYTSSSLVEQATAAFQERANSYQAEIDSNLRATATISQNMGYNDFTKDYLQQFLSSGVTDHGSIATINDLFSSFSVSSSSAHHMNIYDLQGNAVGVGAFTRAFQVSLDDLDWVQELKRTGAKRYLSAPYLSNEYSYSANSYRWYLSICCPITSKFGTLLGYSETIQQCKTLFLDIIADEKANQDLAVYVFNGDGALIYPYRSQAPVQHYFDAARSGEPVIADNPDTGVTEIIAASVSGYSGWTYVCTEPQSVLLSPVRQFSRTLLLIFLALTAVSLTVAWFLARGMTQPVHQLADRVKNTTLHTLDKPAGTVRRIAIRELDDLDRQYSDTSEKLRLSMNHLLEAQAQEAKSRYFALQAQINPHFYYNSLSSIMILAESGETGTIVTVSKYLSDLMHYATRSASLSVPLREEMEYIRKYLYCMKVRYQSSLSFQIHLPDELREVSIPRLIVQPLVENSFKYGIDCAPPWEVAIDGLCTDGGWEIRVSDRGPGFSEEALSRIRQKLQEADRGGLPDQEGDGLGLVNVYLRWKLFWEGHGVFRLENRAGGGASVILGVWGEEAGNE